MPLTPIPCTTADEVAPFLASMAAGLVYKHSFSCDLSAMAMDEVAALTAAHPDIPIWLVDVIGQRSLSRAIESVTGIQHESPQALLVRDGAVAWHASHRRVTQRALAEAWTAARPS